MNETAFLALLDKNNYPNKPPLTLSYKSDLLAKSVLFYLGDIALGGTSIEWYDFFIYGTAAALVFPTLFFAEDMPRYVSLIASFSTFAVGFLARPVGGVVFGHFGDRVGRKAALVTALMMMGATPTRLAQILTPSIQILIPAGATGSKF